MHHRRQAPRHDQAAILLTRECDDGALHLGRVLHVNRSQLYSK
jgi:hypothetical protein